MSRKKPASPIVSTSALARHLGLSRWTISRVLNGHPEVKPETSRRVRAAMAELGFVPSPLGRGLRGARTGMVGVCFREMGTPIVSTKIATLQRVLREAGFRALLEVTGGNPDLELTAVAHFISMRVDGLVLAGGIHPRIADRLEAMLDQQAIPAVLLDPLDPHGLPSVRLDRAAGIRKALEHLLDLGHSRIALLGIDDDVPYGAERCRGLRALLSERAMPWETHVVAVADPRPGCLDFAYGRRLTDRFLELSPRPTAILALNDRVAVGAVASLQERGLSLPREVSVVGFDNLEIAAHVTPALTTVDQRVDVMMLAAVSLLADQIRGQEAPPTGSGNVEPVLVVRASTGPAPAVPTRRGRPRAGGPPAPAVQPFPPA